jgi:hypothetical protein
MARYGCPTSLALVALGFVTAVLILLVGCSRSSWPPPTAPLPASPMHASVSAHALALSVDVPSSSLAASSTQTATVTVTNASAAATQVVTPVVESRIVDSSGKLVVDWPRPYPTPFPGLTRLEPHGKWTGQLRFRVPPAGGYTLEVRDTTSPFPGPVLLRFLSRL